MYSPTHLYTVTETLMLSLNIYGICIFIITYRKRRKFQGVINFVVFADTTIPRNLILGWVLIYYTIKPNQELYQFTQQFT